MHQAHELVWIYYSSNQSLMIRTGSPFHFVMLILAVTTCEKVTDKTPFVICHTCSSVNSFWDNITIQSPQWFEISVNWAHINISRVLKFTKLHWLGLKVCCTSVSCRCLSLFHRYSTHMYLGFHFLHTKMFRMVPGMEGMDFLGMILMSDALRY